MNHKTEKKLILLIEDDHSLGQAIKETLTQEQYQVELVTSLTEAKTKKFMDYQLILLDWMLPDGQGIDLLKNIPKEIPVIMLTARTDVIDKVLGLESGARDYITKPFEPRELLARIRVQLRLQETNPLKNGQPEELLIENKSEFLQFNTSERRVFYHQQEIHLAKMEYDLLYLLASSPNKVFSREKLLDLVWGYENYPTTRTVDTHVLQIRQKFSSDILETVRGIGYRFNPKHT